VLTSLGEATVANCDSIVSIFFVTLSICVSTLLILLSIYIFDLEKLLKLLLVTLLFFPKYVEKLFEQIGDILLEILFLCFIPIVLYALENKITNWYNSFRNIILYK
jgi:c-di-AMP phosphodiesterase-like protein